LIRLFVSVEDSRRTPVSKIEAAIGVADHPFDPVTWRCFQDRRLNGVMARRAKLTVFGLPALDHPSIYAPSLMAFDFSPESLDHEFPVRRNLVYFNHAAVSPLPRRVADTIAAHIENTRDRGAADWRRWFASIEKARETAARFIGARASEVGFVPSTSWGLNLVAHAVDWRPGDNVVGDDMEFPSNVYPWLALAPRGVEHRRAKNRVGRIGLDDLVPLVDARTRAVVVSWVAFHNGWVYPLEEIGRFCRERGILLIVDAIQGLGALPMDVARENVDVLVADGHKWLLGAEACAVFFVAESARERVPPPFSGWWNVRIGDSYLDYELEFLESGRRYEAGSLPTGQVLGLAAAIDLLTEMGRDTVRERILEVVRALAGGLSERGWRITTPEPFASGILAAVPPRDDAKRLAKRFEEAGIIVSPREGAVRFSPHAYNDLDQVERILATLT
jgi:cysteine desulfurase/selenocysteine lyase